MTCSHAMSSLCRPFPPCPLLHTVVIITAVITALYHLNPTSRPISHSFLLRASATTAYFHLPPRHPYIAPTLSSTQPLHPNMCIPHIDIIRTPSPNHPPRPHKRPIEPLIPLSAECTNPANNPNYISISQPRIIYRAPPKRSSLPRTHRSGTVRCEPEVECLDGFIVGWEMLGREEEKEKEKETEKPKEPAGSPPPSSRASTPPPPPPSSAPQPPHRPSLSPRHHPSPSLHALLLLKRRVDTLYRRLDGLEQSRRDREVEGGRRRRRNRSWERVRR